MIMGIKITTDDKPVTVWRYDGNSFPQYSIGISKRGDDGKWITEYQQIVFRKGVELENNEQIYIYDAFPKLNVWKGRDGQIHKRQVWQILDFDYATKQAPSEQQAAQVTYDDLPDSFAAAEDDVPF